MKIHLRKRLTSQGTKESLYLEFYSGYTKTSEGKIKHFRKYENLGLCIHKNPGSYNLKKENEFNLDLASNIRLLRLNEYNQGKFNFHNIYNSKVRFLEYARNLICEKNTSRGNHSVWTSLYNHLSCFCNENITFAEVDTVFIKKFKEYLDIEAKQKTGICLSQNTKHAYFNKFRCIIKKALDDKILNDNPLVGIKPFKEVVRQKVYLTLQELELLKETDCRFPELKRAFLFSCLTGLRWSDIIKLKWSEIDDGQNEWKIVFTQKKTKSLEYLYISKQARIFLGERQLGDHFVFKNIEYGNTMNKALIDWCVTAKIYKHITFHCARHTNAILSLEYGVDIHTVSKRLGHKNLHTTERYAKVVDKKNKEAAEAIPFK